MRQLSRARIPAQYFLRGDSHARFRVSKLPVVKNPLSPIELLHSIDNWPRTARLSRRMSFCSASKPSCWPSSCSTRNATCKTSRGFRVGGCDSDWSGRSRSQFNDIALNGALGLRRVCYRISWVLASGNTYLDNNRSISDILELSFKSKA